MFSVNERLQMARQSINLLELDNVDVRSFSNQFLVIYAQSVSARFILRGIRSESDYEYERVMKNVNTDINPNITSVFLIPPRGIADVSSSMVKGLIGLDGWQNVVKDYVPEPVFDKLTSMIS